MRIHEKIRVFRQSKGWTQEDMAIKLEMSPGGYGNIERGETDIPISRLEQIAQIFGTDLIEFFNFGEKNVICLIGDNSSYTNNTLQNITTSKDLVFELQKCQILLQEKDKEIQYLKEIIEWMKKST